MVSKTGKNARGLGESVTTDEENSAEVEYEHGSVIEPEVVKYSEQSFDDADLAQVKSFADATALVGEEATNIADVLGTGFSILPSSDKDKLIGVPFIVLEYKQHEGSKGTYASLLVVTRDDEKYVINDGGTGIPRQLDSLTSKQIPVVGLYVPKGIKKSVYDHPEHGESVTYYLDTTA